VVWHNNFCAPGEDCRLGDVNGDGRADLIAFAKGTGGSVSVAVSAGNAFGIPANSKRVWANQFCTGSGSTAQQCRVADMNGDGNDDIVAFARDGDATKAGDVYVSLSNKYDFGPSQKWHEDFCRNAEECQLGDVNQDARKDAVVFTQGFLADANVALSQR
jgi:hypothetical protein